MLGATREQEDPVSLLDLGCGLAHMLDYIRSHQEWDRIRYTGLDLSRRYIEAARERHPDADLIEVDILDRDAALPDYDYVVMNGVFNYRGELSRERMLAYWKRMTVRRLSPLPARDRLQRDVQARRLGAR